jgi:hypothetical protein
MKDVVEDPRMGFVIIAAQARPKVIPLLRALLVAVPLQGVSAIPVEELEAL